MSPLRRFGEHHRWAFQVTDDILDVEESPLSRQDRGKTRATKSNLPRGLRSGALSSDCHDLATKAIAELALYADRARAIREIAEFLVHRRA